MPMFLSAVTEPAILLLLACAPYPIDTLDAVNVRNRLELVRPDLVDLPRLLQPRRASLTASVHPVPRPVKRGIEYDFEATLRHDVKRRTRLRIHNAYDDHYSKSEPLGEDISRLEHPPF